ncbi:MAG: gas vesicle protein GvpG [Candidatus Delongbacteria bacterium]|nr:gas vesicle protein GvpG [Candidatus Delongbacteria bacterium]MCG2759647.1 gas vesicle protein GvpG [Candidatus Delongbacteria bacterium]
MLLIDDILCSPFKSLLWIFREIHNTVEKEIVSGEQAIKDELSEIYMMLETNQITEEEFESREKILLDRYEQIQELNKGNRSFEDNDEDDEE